MKDKIVDAYYHLKYSLLNAIDTVKFSLEDLVYQIKDKLISNKEEKFEVEEEKPAKKKKKKPIKKKK
jgi:hypothetical protein